LVAPARLPIALVVLLCAALAWAAPAWADDLTFEPVELGTTPDVQEITLVNDGDDALELGVASITGADADAFSVAYDYCMNHTLAPGDDCDLAVEFDPLRVGPNSTNLDVPMVGEAGPYRIALSGEGRPSLRVTPAAVDFGALPALVGLPTFVSPSREVTIQNVTDEELGGLWRKAPHGFSVTAQTCGSTLAPGSSCSYTISFIAGSEGRHTGDLEVRGNGHTIARVPVAATRLPYQRHVPRSSPMPATPRPSPTPSATTMLRARLGAAMQRWRHASRGSLRRGGLVLTGFKAPADGQLELFVVGRRQVALGSVEVSAGKAARLRARLLPAGRRLLKADRDLRWRAVLKFVARADGRVSRVSAALHLRAK
jgi:hypothetical protein